jgi:hypothetical protein
VATYIVQLTTDSEPRPSYEVSAAEYERLTDLGLVVGGPPDPVDPDLFDSEVAALVADVNSQTRDALKDGFVASDTVRAMVPLTQGAYDAIGTKDPATLYIITP